MAEKTATRTDAKVLRGRRRWSLSLIPMGVAAATAFCFGSTHGEVRPAATDEEIARFALGESLLPALWICLGAVAAVLAVWRLAHRESTINDRILDTIADLAILSVATGAAFVLGWFVGLYVFPLPTTG
ncbi:hypothetical protein [Microbacterium sp. ZW T5_56]|uniref:hypothetical protein n=1 Tax=Microbacterium sp. ZW T5_56 TaxID=3378081 RepID=UPI003853DD27